MKTLQRWRWFSFLLMMRPTLKNNSTNSNWNRRKMYGSTSKQDPTKYGPDIGEGAKEFLGVKTEVLILNSKNRWWPMLEHPFEKETGVPVPQTLQCSLLNL